MMRRFFIFFLYKISGSIKRILSFVEHEKNELNSGNIHLASDIIYSDVREIKPINIEIDNSIKPRIVLLIPGLHSKGFYGGVATALLVAIKFALINKRSLLIVETLASEQADKSILEKFYGEKGINIKDTSIEVVDLASRANLVNDKYISINCEDLFIASAWGDAWLIDSFKLKNKFLYLVQDYEPIFYSNSDRYIMSESTYHLSGYIPLCNTRLMHEHMVALGYEKFKKYEYWFEPAVSNILTGLVKSSSKRRIFLYGRPAVARNLFYSAIISLQKIFALGRLNVEEWEIYMAGQDGIGDIEICDKFYIKNLGKMEVRDYIKFSKSVDVAISLMMAPHPNYPTLEFASIGSAVVTTKYSVKTSLKFYSKNIIASDLNIESITDSIIEAASWTVEQRVHAMKENNILSDWNVALDSVVSSISKEFTQLD